MLSAHNIVKKFHTDGQMVNVLQDVSVEINDGEFVAIVGRSGSGKTTLLNVLSTLVRADSGELRYGEDDLSQLSEKRLNQLRRSDFSVIFQFHHLLPYLTALENILLPFMQSMRPVKKTAMEKAHACLERVGLADKGDRLPGNLSGGEQQRVAIARALVKSSKILFADEPTGSLDRTTGEQIMALLLDLHQEGLSVVMVTHDPSYAAMAQRSVYIEDGIIQV
jgi:putative ABC transport system ATP-binding protein